MPAPAVPSARDIPDPSLFDSLDEPLPVNDCKEVEDLLPTVSQCLAHLELLGCFATLRSKVENSPELDAALELLDAARKEEKEKLNNGGKNGPNLWHLKFERWKRFVGIASWRFYAWWKSVRESGELGNVVSRERLPPLDVLLGLHTFMLNPRSWHDFCYARDMMDVWRASYFDWQLIHSLIDNYDFKFMYPKEAAEYFETSTNLKADLFEELRTTKTKSQLGQEVECPICHKRQTLPYIYPRDDCFATVLTQSPVVCCFQRDGLFTHGQLFAIFRSAEQDLFRATRERGLLLDKPTNRVPDILDLPLGILRQGRFIHDIHTHNLMIRSPAVKDTVQLGITQFSHFMSLIARFPKTMFVPTTHVDLAWHTLLLSPARYKAYSMRKTSTRAISMENMAISLWARILVRLGYTSNQVGEPRFVDHNDKIGPASLSKGRDITSWLHKRLYKKEKPWKTCLCWECQYADGDEKVLEGFREVERERRREIGDREARRRIVDEQSLVEVMEEKAEEVFSEGSSS